MGIGFAVFLFFFYLLPNGSVRIASIGILILAVSVIVCRISELYNARVFEGSLIKSVSYLIAGITIYFMFANPYPKVYLGIGLNISIGKLIFFSFLVLVILR